jgi:hypothetical protein
MDKNRDQYDIFACQIYCSFVVLDFVCLEAKEVILKHMSRF